MRRRWTRISLVGPLVLAMGLTAVPTSASASVRNSSSASGALTISNESGELWPCSFNPYNPAVWGESVGFVYEPLVFVNSLENGKATPWLASSYAWSDANKVLTFTIRKGVKFSDGTPMTAADVAFTFNMLKANPALDLNAVWSVLKSVVQNGDNVVLTFKTTAVPYFYYVADQIDVLPQHIWASIKNPVTYGDASPVGTGPYTVSQCSGQNITYTANPNYWQPGLPKVKTIEYPAFTSNDPANEELATGVAQLGAQFIPNIKAFYTSKSPNYHYWFPPIANVSRFINLTVAPLNDLAVRQAIAYGVDRPRVSAIGEYGYEPPSNQASIVTPTFSSWLDTSLLSKYNYSYDPAKAVSVLEKDGYKKGSDGIFAKDGKELSFTIINVGGNSDWVAAVQVIASELAQVGIKLTPDNLAYTDFTNELFTGKYQLAYNNEVGGPSPYYELRQLLYGPNSAPIGKLASTNWERYINPSTDKLFDEYAATTSPSVQHSIVDQLEQVMLTALPVIPMTEEVDWYQYDTAAFSGWVTPQDPYAQPAIYILPDDEVLLLHLTPK
ncbi:MAG: ABC transporter substrate-binding protein [Acidimicrobiales bacterium]